MWRTNADKQLALCGLGPMLVLRRLGIAVQSAEVSHTDAQSEIEAWRRE